MADAQRVVTIQNKKGLHARAAAKFVKMAAQFPCKITVTRLLGQLAIDLPDDPDWRVSATSILGLMMLGAEPGTQLLLEADGEQADEGLAALQQLVDSLFDEGE